MKVIFNGVLEAVSGGCVPCGHKRSSKRVMITKKTYIMPSGISKTFYVGRTVDVLDSEGKFLLDFTYTDNHGNTQNVFSEV